MLNLDEYIKLEIEANKINEEIIQLREKQHNLFDKYKIIYGILTDYQLKLNILKQRGELKPNMKFQVEYEVEHEMLEFQDLLIEIALTKNYHVIWEEDIIIIQYVNEVKNEL